MSYWDIFEMSRDLDLQGRIYACAAQEHDEAPLNLLVICAAPGWGEAWASAIAGGVQQPGRDQGVISDGEILSSVQASMST